MPGAERFPPVLPEVQEGFRRDDGRHQGRSGDRSDGGGVDAVMGRGTRRAEVIAGLRVLVLRLVKPSGELGPGLMRPHPGKRQDSDGQ